MGAELSSERQVGDDVAPLVLSARTVRGVADFIKSGKCQKVVFMVCPRKSCQIFLLLIFSFSFSGGKVGAGISTSAG